MIAWGRMSCLYCSKTPEEPGGHGDTRATQATDRGVQRSQNTHARPRAAAGDRSSAITRPSPASASGRPTRSQHTSLVNPRHARSGGERASLAGSPPRSAAHAARSSRSTAHGPTAVHLVHGGRDERRKVRRVPASDAALMPDELKAREPQPSVADRRREADLLAHDGNHVGTGLRDRAGAQRPPLPLCR